jgi:ABC-type Fe3+/spermidine/putrescine transport system ATPase subunit
VADFIGAANIIDGTECETDGLPGLDIGGTVVQFQPGGERPAGPGNRRLAAIRTIHPQLHRERGDLTVNIWPGRIEHVTMFGDFVDLVVGWPGGQLRVKTLSSEEFIEGEEIYVHVPPGQIVLLDDAPSEVKA